MIARIGFLAVVSFWITMNVLLIRNEFAGSDRGGSPVAIEGVLERLLTSPDPATLEVRENGKAIGFVHWYPDPGEEPNRVYASDYVPEGMVRSAQSLQVRLDGNVSPSSLGARLHISFDLRLSTNRMWESFDLEVGTRTTRVVLRADQSRNRLEWKITKDNAIIEDQLDLGDARDPQKLLGRIAGPLASLLSGPWKGVVPAEGDLRSLLETDARLDWMPLGSSKVRIYRIRLRLAHRYEATLIINRAGEVLRIDLPGGWRLVNEGLSSF